MKQIIMLSLLFFGSFEIKCQSTYFNKLYNDDNWSAALTILESDPGYVVCGVSGVISNGYMFRRIVLTSIDDQGNQVWWKTYGEDFHDYYVGFMRGCINTSDGGYVVSGSIYDTITSVGLLIKFNQNGDSLWSRIYNDPDSSDYLATVLTVCLQLQDKGFIITGYVGVSQDDDDIILMKTDSLGEIKWLRTYGQLHWYDEGYSLCQLPDGGFLVGLDREKTGNNTSRDPGLLKVDSLGNQIWIKYYGGIYDDGHSVVYYSQDGNYLVGSTYAVSQPHPDYPDHKVWIFKTDTAGNILWDRKYSDKTFLGWCSTIDELNDGSIIVSGTGGFQDSFSQDGWILKANQSGDSIWMRKYGYYPLFMNDLNDLRVTSDDGIIISGCALGDPEWEQSIWVQKLDSIGCDSAGCDTTVGIIQLNPKYLHQGNITIYPNPATDWIHILFRDIRPIGFMDRDAVIFNVYGEKVASIKIPNIAESYDYNVSDLSSGLYLLVIRERQKVVFTGKFLIAR